MIQALLASVIARLQSGLAPGLAAGRITEGPIGPPPAGQLPRVAVYQGPLSIAPTATDAVSSAPRPEDFRESFTVDPQQPQGPYALTKTPLQGSVLCKAIYPAGNGKLLIEGEARDFSVDYNSKTITFHADVGGVVRIQARYSVVSVFSLQEFKQDFLIDAYAASVLDAEKWSALCASVILTNLDGLKEEFNDPARTGHVATGYSQKGMVGSIRLLESTPEFTAGQVKIQLRFQTQGQLKFIRTDAGAFGIISKIYSPGKEGVAGSVEIDAELE